jgi:DNA-binding LytR/AlgR family response regulator
MWFILAPIGLIGLYALQFKFTMLANLLTLGIPCIAIVTASRVVFDYSHYSNNLVGYYILFIPSQTAAFCFIALFWYWFVYQRCVAEQLSTPSTTTYNNIGLQVEHLGRNVYLPFDQILYIKSAGNYIEVTSKENEYLKRATLKELQAELPDYFLQVHRSHVVNLTHVEQLQNSPSGIGIVTMSDNEQLNVSKSLKSQLKKQLASCPLESKA